MKLPKCMYLASNSNHKEYLSSHSHLFLQFLQIGSFLFDPISQSKTLNLVIFKLEKIMLDQKSQKSFLLIHKASTYLQFFNIT